LLEKVKALLKPEKRVDIEQKSITSLKIAASKWMAPLRIWCKKLYQYFHLKKKIKQQPHNKTGAGQGNILIYLTFC
jgi:hypothetical protein